MLIALSVMETTAPNRAITVSKLGKIFMRPLKRSGLRGAALDLFAPCSEELKALSNISLEICSGEIVGLVGPNGAGKSTLIKILTGILRPTEGTVEVFAFTPSLHNSDYLRKIGVMFGQRSQLWWDIPVKESLLLNSRVYKIERCQFDNILKTLSEVLQLGEILAIAPRHLSLGQRVKCDLACSLLHQPKLLFLDEPAIGLDAATKESFRHFLKRIHIELGTTVFLTTHDLREVSHICGRILLLDKGKLVFDGTQEQLRNLSIIPQKMILEFPAATQANDLNSLFDGRVKFRNIDPLRIEALFKKGNPSSIEILEQIKNRFEVRDCLISEPDIEEIVLRVCSHGS